MITKYEKITTSEIELDGKSETITSFQDVDKEEDADYIHYCGHDSYPPKPCTRVRIKK